MPRPHLSRRTAALSAVAVAGCASTAAGLILLLGQVQARIGPDLVTGHGGDLEVSCGNVFTSPPLDGVVNPTRATRTFVRMTDNLCSRAKAPRRAGGGALTGAGVLALACAGLARLAAARRAE